MKKQLQLKFKQVHATDPGTSCGAYSGPKDNKSESLKIPFERVFSVLAHFGDIFRRYLSNEMAACLGHHWRQLHGICDEIVASLRHH